MENKINLNDITKANTEKIIDRYLSEECPFFESIFDVIHIKEFDENYNFGNFTVELIEYLLDKSLFDVIDILINLLNVKLKNIIVYDFSNKKYLDVESKEADDRNFRVNTIGHKIVDNEFKILILVYYDRTVKGN